jgi:phage shock protein PspC (stress-responsive transcriptional regulator)
MTENAQSHEGPQPDSPQAGGPPAPHRPPLRRSRTDRKIAGVAGGLGRYLDIDPLIFRVILVVLALFGGSGLLLYALGWLLIPEEGEEESELQRLLSGRGTPKVAVAVLIGILGLAAFGRFFDTGFGFGGLVALGALGLAAYLVSRSDPPAGTAGGGPPPPAAPPGAFGQTPGTAYTSGTTGTTVPLPGGPVPPGPPPGAPYPPGSPYPPPPPAPPRERSPLGRITISAALLVAGLLIGWEAASGRDVPAEVVLAAALGTVGLGLVVGAFYGRARGLVVLGVLLAVATVATAAVDVPVHGGTGDRRWAPTSVAEVRSPYRLGAGQATVDLRDLAVPAGQTLPVTASVGAGQLVVQVPRDAALDVIAHAGIGTVRMPNGPNQDGLDAGLTWTDAGTGTAGTIKLDLEVGAGNVEVRRATS